MPALRAVVPSRARITMRVLLAVVAGATLYVLDGSASAATSVAVGFLLLTLGADTIESAAGDYADHALLGGLLLAFSASVAVAGAVLLGVLGCLAGGWLLIDGLQHLRHGVTRETVTEPYSHDGGPVTGLARVFVRRLLEPFRL